MIPVSPMTLDFRFGRRAAGLLCAAVLFHPQAARGQTAGGFRVEEATIAQIHAAFRSGAITCRALVDHYIKRIESYDKQLPLNAIVVVNPAARQTADSLDRRVRTSGFVGPLHCVPMIVKDNYDTYDLPTTAGSASLKGARPERDAPVVKRVRDAGAIVIAKSNMGEFAFSPLETRSSILGVTHNPYALDRVPAGSSGGTAAAVAASFGAVGLGTDTGNSIRGPSAHTALVGIRPTMGLASRAGVVPLNLGADVTGPMARTLADAVAVLQVIAGPDPLDKVTLASTGKVPASYASFMKADGLRGARLGILRAAYERPTTDTGVVRVFHRAVGELRAAGATVVDTVVIAGWSEFRSPVAGGCSPFKFELNKYLADHAGRVPVKSLEEILATGQFDSAAAPRLRSSQTSQHTDTTAGCAARDTIRSLRGALIARTMDSLKLDALIYPTWSNPPRLIGDMANSSPAGDNNQTFSPQTGFPAITVPMGYTLGDVLPAGLQFLGRAWDEGTLIRLAFAYEQRTMYRKPPASAPPLGRF
jgi:amidase